MSQAPDCQVLTLGEPLVLFAATEAGPLADASRFERFAAGAELNVAIGLARLGCGGGDLSRMGDDSFGQFLLDVLDRDGIARRGVSIDGQRPTGFMLKSRADDGSDPAIEYHPSRLGGQRHVGRLSALGGSSTIVQAT